MKKTISVLLLTLVLLLLPGLSAQAAAKDLDEIERYEITVSVNEDGSLNLLYDIAWRVLDSDSEGPLEWVKIGIPNRHYREIALSDHPGAAKKAGYLSDGGSYARIDLDRKYYAGEVAEFSFCVVQEYMYELAGETAEFRFTPGWFEDIRVDSLTVRWDADQVLEATPEAQSENGMFVWDFGALGKGEKQTVSVLYPTDAFAFDEGKQRSSGGASVEVSEDDDDDWIYGIIGVLFFFFILFVIVGCLLSAFRRSASFSDGKPKITRTRVEYYPTCPGCGAPRPEGKNNCEHCGRSFIKSETVIKESDIPDNERSLRGKRTNGIYPYVYAPHTYMRVRVTPPPPPRSSSGGVGTRGFSGTRSRGGGGCVHSSCACASCACACACACAGGGRAGCSTKDFYNTGLKLRQLERKGR